MICLGMEGSLKLSNLCIFFLDDLVKLLGVISKFHNFDFLSDTSEPQQNKGSRHQKFSEKEKRKKGELGVGPFLTMKTTF